MGAPAPDLVLTAMLRLGVDDVRETAVAMSTEAGVKAGRRAGAGVVAGVLTGTVPDGAPVGRTATAKGGAVP